MNGDVDMKIFSKLYNYYRYKLDTLKTGFPNVKIERFDVDNDATEILVTYRIGRNKLNSKMHLSQFEEKFFDRISTFDQHRLTKFGILQTCLQKMFHSDHCSKIDFLNFIKEEAADDQLF